jgi:hypothetical protein
LTEVFTGLTGTGDATLAVPGRLDHIGVSVTTIPAGAAVMEPTHPWRLMKVGWIAPAHLGFETSWPASVFCGSAQWIDFERERFSYAAPGPYADRIRYHLEPGAVANLYVNQVVAPTVLNSSLMPWDRAQVNLQQANTATFTAPASGNFWTFTTPSNKKLWLSSAELWILRYAVATTPVLTLLTLTIGSNVVSEIREYTNVLGFRERVELPSAPIIVGSSQVVTAAYFSNDTAGTHIAGASLTGFYFDP